MTNKLDLEILKAAVIGSAAAFRCIAEYQPAGGVGDKIFPPTYEGAKYATEKRRLPGFKEDVECVLLDSVQSQANRMELALLEAWEKKLISIPVVVVDFAGNELPRALRVTSLEAPHRIADAILRDSLLGDSPFRTSALGKRLDEVSARDATVLFEVCPTALVFGMWDSTGPRGALGAKFARAMVSEIVGIDVVTGVRTSSRIDPAQIEKKAGPLFVGRDGDWTPDEADAKRDKLKKPVKWRKDGKPSEANHGNVTPSIKDGGVTIGKALRTTVLSLPALRRLRFPLPQKPPSQDEVDAAARVALAALALCGAAVDQDQGFDLRSRCQIHPTAPLEWELLDKPGQSPLKFSLDSAGAIKLYNDALAAALKAGLPFMKDVLSLKPMPKLVELVKKSQQLAMAQAGDEAEEGN